MRNWISNAVAGLRVRGAGAGAASTPNRPVVVQDFSRLETSQSSAAQARGFAAMKNSWTKPGWGITFMEIFMPLVLLARNLVLCFGLTMAIPTMVFGQAGFVAQGGEYPIAGSLPGDQTWPAMALSPSGGYIVWEDNITDGDGQGISARRIDSSLSGSLSVFRVNLNGVADQQRPKVTMLDNGGAAFVWQGGPQGKQQIYASFLSTSNTWVVRDILVNTSTNSHHLDPAIAKLVGGNVVIVWSSWDQDGSMQGVYGQRFSPSGVKLGGEFRVNLTTLLNQRTPAIAGLSDGNFVVAWISEKQLSDISFDVSVFARRFNANGAALDAVDVQVNTGTNVCANPSVASSPAGGFMVAWGEKDLSVKDYSWDVYGRAFSNAGVGGTVRRLNTVQYGDQFAPRLAAVSSRYMAVWTSLGQDASWEGVYGQFLQTDGSFAGGEFRANTTVVNHQIQPAVASDGGSRFLVAWTSFGGGINSFDLQAQRYVDDAQPLPPPGAPFVTVLSSNALSITWPEVGGFNVTNYEVYADGAVSATAVVANNWWTMTNLAPSSTHWFRLAYVLTDGRRSPLSGATTNTTYSGGATWGGIPQDWMITYFGNDIFAWPSPNADSDGDGVSNKNEFLAGTDPNNSNSVLRTQLEPSPQGLFLVWNTQAGLIYQVQVSINMGAWSNAGGPRFAAGNTDSLNLGGGGTGSTFYRIVRLR